MSAGKYLQCDRCGETEHDFDESSVAAWVHLTEAKVMGRELIKSADLCATCTEGLRRFLHEEVT